MQPVRPSIRKDPAKRCVAFLPYGGLDLPARIRKTYEYAFVYHDNEFLVDVYNLREISPPHRWLLDINVAPCGNLVLTHKDA